MGLTKNSTGQKILDEGLKINKGKDDKLIALMGNPNVGKSTLFNALTGMNQHTGNWPGKTVASAHGNFKYKDDNYILVDLPGTYSLSAHSFEEEVARDFLAFQKPDAAIVICDATCLERNLNLVLQTISLTKKVIVAVNLMDEAKKRNISIDINKLKDKLNVPVVPITARSKEGFDKLLDSLYSLIREENPSPFMPSFRDFIEDSIKEIEPLIDNTYIDNRFLATKLICCDTEFIRSVDKHMNLNLLENKKINQIVDKTIKTFKELNLNSSNVEEEIISTYIKKCEEIANYAIDVNHKSDRGEKLDKILTGKWTGIPIMLLLLGFIFWLTIAGANYPSQLISTFLFWVQDKLKYLLDILNTPQFLSGLLIDGVFKTLAWVVSVMLPPMAIFFPLFTLLEDFGYLPRVAFHLDHSFQKAGACGKQALTTCMGFGCNAAGIVGCRIIDSKRERLIAMITNSFTPCNGRFPTLIALISIFFAGIFSNSFVNSLFSSSLLLLLIVFSLIITFLVSRFLSHTILKGIPSSFTLELPPYRRPQIGKVIVRSIFDRTLFVLGRAVVVAAPAGLILWILANVKIYDLGLLQHISNFLNPFASLFGMDGVILLSFILAFPANEIFLPCVLMCYLSQGSLIGYESLSTLKEILVSNGWTSLTAICVMLFSLMHWPCSTTCLTIKKESGKLKWTLLSILVPTVCGFCICFIVSIISKIIGALI